MTTGYEQAEYHRWPSGDCRSAAVLGFEPQDFETRYGLSFRRDIDDLDYHRVAWLRLASGRRVMLLRYERNQYPGTEILVDAADDRSAALRELLDALALPDTAVTWTPEGVSAAPGAVA